MSLTGHRSKVMKKQAKYGQNGKIHISTNSPYFGLQDKPSSRAIKKIIIKQKIKTTERIVKEVWDFGREGRGGYWEGQTSSATRLFQN